MQSSLRTIAGKPLAVVGPIRSIFALSSSLHFSVGDNHRAGLIWNCHFEPLLDKFLPAELLRLSYIEINHFVWTLRIEPVEFQTSLLEDALIASERLDHALARFRTVELPSHPDIRARVVCGQRIEIAQVAFGDLLPLGNQSAQQIVIELFLSRISSRQLVNGAMLLRNV